MVPLEPSAWDLDRVVQELRRSRSARRDGVEAPGRERHQLPSRVTLERVAQGLTAALFPSHFGPSDLTAERIDYFVGDALGTALRALETQVQCELEFAGARQSSFGFARSATREFAARLPAVHELLESDVRAAYEGDPAARSLDEALFCYPGVTAILHHRLAHELYRLELPLLARILAELAHAATGIDIHPGAEIGPSFFIDHGTGVVIGETAVVGARVRLYQGVTLGAKSFPLDEDGVAHKGLQRHPVVEDDVVIYAGATILGRITIGRGSSIGGNVWLTRSVPPASRVTQVQARSEVFSDGGGI
ncbi:MAG: serine O-acetyltransferase [Polyangiaceae bacterium]